MNRKRELTIGQTTMLLLADKIMFSSELNGDFATFYIPDEFSDIAVEFYDLYLEQGCPTAFLGCRKDYDIAIRLSVQDGKMIDWHYTK